MSVDCSDGEYPDIENERRVRARKEHSCDACKETIERGHLYVKHTLIYEGTVDTTVRCLRCDAIYQQLVVIHADCCLELPDLSLNCGHEFKERWGKEPPPELARLAFLTPTEMQAEALAKLVAT